VSSLLHLDRSPEPGIREECECLIYVKFILSIVTSFWFLLRLPGPPFTKETSVTTLVDAGVNVAIGVVDEYAARNTKFDLAWVCYGLRI